MNRTYLRHILFVTLLAGGLAACNVARNYRQPGSMAGLYRGADTTDTTNMAVLRYSEIFGDTILQHLIATGLSHNLDLLTAYTRIQQSAAYYEQTRSALLPTLNANAGITVSKLSEAQGFGIRTSLTQYQLGLSSSWEADIWGKLRSNKRANLANLFQTVAGSQAVKTSVVAGIAGFYYTLLALDQQLLITQKTVNNWDTTVSTIKELKKAARVTEAAVVQSEAQRYAVEVTIPDVKQRIRETENALSLLLGQPPGPVRRSTLDAQHINTALQTGVPAQLLAYRPDVQQAEMNYRYNFELTNVARAFFYPSLNITASSGMQAIRANQFFDVGSLAASIGFGLTQPIFNQRLNRTRLAVAEAAQQGALLGFNNALLTAGQEVSNALYQYEMAREKMQVRTNQLNALEKSVSYSEELLQYGFATYPEVITARQALLSAELGRVNDRLQQLQAMVNLYRALGGGWR